MKIKPDETYSLHPYFLNNYPKIYSSGIYVIYYKHICLYVGKSIRLWARPFRIFDKKIRSTNPILKAIVENVDRNKMEIDFYFYPSEILFKRERQYIKYFKPICEIMRKGY